MFCSKRQNRRVIAHYTDHEEALGFAGSKWALELSALGTSCPDHFLRTRVCPMFVPWDPTKEDAAVLKSRIYQQVAEYRMQYKKYYDTYASKDSPKLRDTNPSVVIIPGLGLFGFGKSKKEARITTEFFVNAIHVMEGASALEDETTSLQGFVTNFVWCSVLLVRNKTGHQFLASHSRESGHSEETIIETVLDAPSREVVKYIVSKPAYRGQVQLLEAIPTHERIEERVLMLANYLLCALAGTTWYLQLFFYTMGETQMGRYRFSSWTLHMASIIIFSSLWGVGLKEWKGAGTRAGQLLALALFLLVSSTMIVGYGNYLGLSAGAR